MASRQGKMCTRHMYLSMYRYKNIHKFPTMPHHEVFCLLRIYANAEPCYPPRERKDRTQQKSNYEFFIRKEFRDASTPLRKAGQRQYLSSMKRFPTYTRRVKSLIYKEN